MEIKKIIISRTDAIGDVVLTLPMASILKSSGIQPLDSLQKIKIIFFGKSYTRPVIECCQSVDEFIDYDVFLKLDKKNQAIFLKDLNADVIIHVFPRKDIAIAARSAGIPLRIGTKNRLYHWTTCNKLINLSRKNSYLHEAQLNLELLKPFGYKNKLSLKEIPDYYNFRKTKILPDQFSSALSKEKFKLIIHPKSNVSAREWSLENYSQLIQLLPEDKFQFIITGGKNEEAILIDWAHTLSKTVINFSGRLMLDELISLIDSCNGIIAASTGPLHIGAALGKFALGIYPPIRPMDPRRWAPVGRHAEFLVADKSCSDCRKNPALCHCMKDVTPGMVANRILKWVE
jgi:heptosyltransferase-3